jgi:Flp pilus assembly protein TadD
VKPDEAWVWVCLGNAYEQFGRTTDAIEAFKQAVKLAPDYIGVWYGLGEAYRQSGREKEADAAFRRARELEPELFK